MTGAAHGGAGAIAVFAFFVLAFLVLVGFVIRFVVQQSRKARGGPPPPQT